MLAAAKYIGAGLACSGLIGAGAGISPKVAEGPKREALKRSNCCVYRAVSVLLSNKIKIFI